MSAGAEVIHKQNKYISIFNELDAVDREHSINLKDAGIRRSFIFNRMAARGIFIECDKNKFYIDNQAAASFKENRRKKGLIILVLIAALAVLFYFVQGR